MIFSWRKIQIKYQFQGHCLIVPLSHVKCATLLDEDVAAEIAEFKSALAAMFRANGGEVRLNAV